MKMHWLASKGNTRSLTKAIDGGKSGAELVDRGGQPPKCARALFFAATRSKFDQTNQRNEDLMTKNGLIQMYSNHR